MTPVIRRARRLAGDVELVGLSLLAWFPNHFVRVLGLRTFGARISRQAVIYHGFQVRSARRLQVGARSQIGDGAILDARGGLTIGEDVNVSTGVQFWSAQHDWTSADFAYQTRPIVVGDRVWLGPNVTVLPGSVIEEGAVVAAGAVVRGTVPAYTLVGGIPARKIADRPDNLTYRLGRPRDKVWWW